MSLRASRWVLAAYLAAIASIVLIANLGGTHAVFGFVAWVPFGDKLGHFVLMGTLAMLTDLATGRHEWKLGRVRVPSGPMVIAALVTAEELSQLALTTRSFDLVDLAADFAGIVALVGLSRALSARSEAEPAPDVPKPH